MKLTNPKITLLVSQESTSIEVKDSVSGITFLSVTLTPQQLSSALSRLSYTDCEVEVYGLDKLGKTQEVENFEFEMPNDLDRWKGIDFDKKIKMICFAALIDAKKEDWESDNYYRSQNSFFDKDGKKFARVTIRRWI